MVPPLWRAYSQLKMKVRALPTWRKPVGDGAKRTRGFESDVDSGIAGRSLMVWAEKSIVKPARKAIARLSN
jgi:hypothetical protein